MADNTKKDDKIPNPLVIIINEPEKKGVKTYDSDVKEVKKRK